jgi:hypothetical protein
MVSFLIVLVFAPVILGLLWMYTLPLSRLDGYTPLKVAFRIVLFVAVFGGIIAQLNFLAHNQPLNVRRFYGMALLVIEAIPILFILISRDPSKNRSKSVNGPNEGGKKGGGVIEEKAGERREVASSYSRTISKAKVTSKQSDGNDSIDILCDTDGVLQVVIPPRRNLDSFIYGVALLACGVAGILALKVWLTHAIMGHQRSHDMTEFIRVLQAIDMLVVGYLLTVILTGMRVLTLNPARLQIQYVLLGLPVTKKSFENAEIKELRYEQWQTQSGNKSVVRRGIRFESGSKTYSFGNSITEVQAHELIERMRRLYAFPVV